MTLRLLAILGHPDDESLGNGGTLAKYAAEGVETFLVTATRGEQGWFGPPEENPGPEKLGKIREAELVEAAKVLGIREVHHLDYHDGELGAADPAEVVAKIVPHVRRIRPDVVLTFDEHGIYGHPDHIAICQAATAALVAAADASYKDAEGLAPHRVAKLYYMVWRREVQLGYEAAFGDLVMHIDAVERRAVTRPAWAVTTTIETEQYWEQVWQAISCHRTQLPGYEKLRNLPDEHHRALWGSHDYYRVYSLVNGGPAHEDDLFAGLR